LETTNTNGLTQLYLNDDKSFVGRFIDYARNIKRYSYLLKQLVRIDIVTTYKRTFIGISWLVITPILSVLIWILLHSAGIINPGQTDIPYPVYVLLSTSIWSFFQGSYSITSNIINNSGRFLVSAKFPHEVLIVEQIAVHCINFIIPFLINLLVLILYGIKFSFAALLFPVALIPLLLLGTGIGLLTALLRVVAVDLSRITDQFISFLMFLTPVVFTPKIELAWLANIVKYNPLTYLIGFPRDLLTQGIYSETKIYLVVSLVSFLFFIFCLMIFMKYAGRLLERLIIV